MEEKDMINGEEFVIDDALIENAEILAAERAVEQVADAGDTPKPKRKRKPKTEGDNVEADKPEPRTRRKKIADSEDKPKTATGGDAPDAPPKKKGRKKKETSEVLTESGAENAVSATISQDKANDAAEEVAPAPKKRGRKKKSEKTESAENNASTDTESAILTPDGEIQTENSENPLSSPEVENNEPADRIAEEFSIFDLDSEPIFDENAVVDTGDLPLDFDSVPGDIIGGDEPEVVDILGFPLEDSDAPEEIDESISDIPPALVEGLPKEDYKEPIDHNKYDPKKPRYVDFIFDFAELFIFTLVAVLIMTTFFVRHSVVDGPSMEGTLHHGDVLVLSDLFYAPKVGDIVVVEDYTTELKKPIVKRVIAVGGQMIKVTPDAIYVGDDEASLLKLEESYVYIDERNYKYDDYPGAVNLENETFEIKFLPGGELDYYQLVVPEGEIFVMGDHRNDSADSRLIGTIDCDAVLGRVLFRLFPFDRFGGVN